MQQGNYIIGELKDKLSSNSFVKEVRGKGLMIGIELTTPCAKLVDICLQNKLLINVTAEHTIRLLPPLIFNKADADTMIEILINCIENFTSAQA